MRQDGMCGAHRLGRVLGVERAQCGDGSGEAAALLFVSLMFGRGQCDGERAQQIVGDDRIDRHIGERMFGLLGGRRVADCIRQDCGFRLRTGTPAFRQC
jgi:hypothetical protein